MAQNENGEETQKSEHDTRRVIVSSTIVLSLSEADGGRCGREVFGQKVLAALACTPYQYHMLVIVIIDRVRTV